MRLIIIEHQNRREVTVSPGANLLAVLQKNGSQIHAPCGGRGTCRKCQVEIIGIGQVLACRTDLDDQLAQRACPGADEPLTVIVPEPAQAQISTDGLIPDFVLSPLLNRGMVSLAEPSLEDQRSDEERFTDATGLNVPFCLLEKLPGALRDNSFQPSFYFRLASAGSAGTAVRFIRPDGPDPLGVAVDIGTTTLAAYLYDLGTGKRLASAAGLNPQRAYGADVISRIDQSSASPEARQALRGAIKGLADRLVVKAGHHTGRSLSTDDIVHYVFAGNTTMLHLLAGLPAAAIARAPFIPVSRRAMTVQAALLGLPLASDAVCQLLPSISGYVGADITAGILACGLHHLPPGQNALLLDIGTNGEIVLAGKHGMIACSTAAGPAFEGANILCGMGGVQGAIDSVACQDGDLVYTTVGESNGNGSGKDNGPSIRPLGICGSGLVAAAAVLLSCGLIDETGRITDEPDSLPAGLQRRLVQYQGQAAILLVPQEISATGHPIIITQKDIRELQNAKAAIAAGISLLIQQAGLQPDQIDRTYIAGGFGNYLDGAHAFRIGLLPPELRGSTRAAGNTAGMGAILCLLDQAALAEAESIARSVSYYELSGDKRFTDLYIEAMMFPES